MLSFKMVSLVISVGSVDFIYFRYMHSKDKLAWTKDYGLIFALCYLDGPKTDKAVIKCSNTCAHSTFLSKYFYQKYSE